MSNSPRATLALPNRAKSASAVGRATRPWVRHSLLPRRERAPGKGAQELRGESLGCGCPPTPTLQQEVSEAQAVCLQNRGNGRNLCDLLQDNWGCRLGSLKEVWARAKGELSQF